MVLAAGRSRSMGYSRNLLEEKLSLHCSPEWGHGYSSPGLGPCLQMTGA